MSFIHVCFTLFKATVLATCSRIINQPLFYLSYFDTCHLGIIKSLKGISLKKD